MCYPESQSHCDNKDFLLHFFSFFYLSAAEMEIKHWLECSTLIRKTEKDLFDSHSQFFTAFSGAKKSIKIVEKYI